MSGKGKRESAQMGKNIKNGDVVFEKLFFVV